MTVTVDSGKIIESPEDFFAALTEENTWSKHIAEMQ